MQEGGQHTAGGGEQFSTLALILSYAYLWFALLENHKLYELRRQKIDVPEQGRQVLLVCNQSVRKRFGLSTQMAEALCTQRLGPFTADAIINDPILRAGILISDDEIREFLKENQVGYLYKLEGTKLSCKSWAQWHGNGSNGFNFLNRLYEGKERWT